MGGRDSSAADGLRPDGEAAPGSLSHPAGDAPTVAGRVDRAEARVGDVITLTVTAVGPRSTPVNLPRTLELAPFSELDEHNRKVHEQDIGDGRMRREWAVQVAAYEPGDIVLPAVDVTYLGNGGEVLTARTVPIAIKITSLLANEPEPKLKDNSPPVRVLERDLLPVYVAGGLVAAAIGALAALAVRRRLRARAAYRPAPPPRPAHEIALEKLDRLGAGGFAEDADHRPYYFALSEVIREYLGARFGFDSLELTTEELLETLRRCAQGALQDADAGRIGAAFFSETSAWLGACDLVKFAKVLPSAAEARGALEAGIRIVESTRPRPEPALAQGASVPPVPQEPARA